MSLYNPGIGHHLVLSENKFVSGHGDTITDQAGREYLDFYANGSLSFGHDTSILRKALEEPLPINVGMYETAYRADAAAALGDLYPGYTAFQFNTSGSLAIEGGLRYAMAITGRNAFAGFAGSFHGRTKATTSLTDMDSCNGERIAGYAMLPYPGFNEQTRGSEMEGRGEDGRIIADVDANLAEIARILDEAGAETFAGVVVEPILSKSMLKPPAGWLNRLKHEVLVPRGILLIADEIFTGGRVGAWSSAVDQGQPADILIICKSFSSGFPFSAVTCREEHADGVARVKGSDATSAQAIQCRVAQLTAQRLVRENILDHEMVMGKTFLEHASRLYEFPSVKRISADGALFGVEFDSLDVAVKAGEGALRNGVLLAAIHRSLRLSPPLNMSVESVIEGVERVHRAVAAAELAREN
jgi:4-aminobutyrate aminotransferase-like enzyme